MNKFRKETKVQKKKIPTKTSKGEKWNVWNRKWAEWSNSRLEAEEEKIGEFEDIAIESIQ